MTAVSGNAFTAAEFNTYIRDNLLETAPAKATTATGYFVATGANAIAERLPTSGFTSSAQNTTTTGSFHDLATVGPSVTVTTGTKALVLFQSHCQNTSSASAVQAISVAISGATTSTATFDRAAQIDGLATNEKSTISGFNLVTLNAGSNTFKLQYYASAGVGQFERRHIIVIPF